MTNLISGVAIATLDKKPLNGMRNPPTDGTTGWFVWGGEFQARDDFFQPWHTSHLLERFPHVATLLEAPPGSRWLADGDYLDTWFDGSLLTADRSSFDPY